MLAVNIPAAHVILWEVWSESIVNCLCILIKFPLTLAIRFKDRDSKHCLHVYTLRLARVCQIPRNNPLNHFQLHYGTLIEEKSNIIDKAMQRQSQPASSLPSPIVRHYRVILVEHLTSIIFVSQQSRQPLQPNKVQTELKISKSPLIFKISVVELSEELQIVFEKIVNPSKNLCLPEKSF